MKSKSRSKSRSKSKSKSKNVEDDNEDDNEYERQRKQNIQRNNFFVGRLTIPTLSSMKRSKKDRTKRKIEWAPDEIEALKEGVKVHGVGHWAQILQDKQFGPRFKNRNNVALKDKYRLLFGARRKKV
jgi:hypothetical protein